MTDVENMGGNITITDNSVDFTILTGSAPVSKMRSYYKEVISYSKGQGKLSCKPIGYDYCIEQDKVVESLNYNPESDLDNPADSVFCAHGAGFTVKWDEVFDYMHLPLYEQKYEHKDIIAPCNNKNKITNYTDDELMRVYEMVFGKIKSEPYREMQTPKHTSGTQYKHVASKAFEKTYLLVDGYNIIHAWDELKEISKNNLEHARDVLIERIHSYNIIKKEEIIVVFDAYKVKGGTREIENIHNINIVYTKEKETADAYIEKTTHTLSKNNRVYVATSDGLEQMIILGQGAIRIPASQFIQDVNNAHKQIIEAVNELNRKNNSSNRIDISKICDNK